MIKFFRRIRQKLIAQNRFSKYLLYAIGEILLVVIGILIALQVNEWNQDRKERHRELGYLNEIRNNLTSDSLQLINIVETNNKKVQLYDSIVERFDIKYPKEAHSRFIALNIKKIAGFELFKLNATAFGNMKSTDNLGILSSHELRLKLVEYYNFNVEIAQEKLVMQTRQITEYLNRRIATKELVQQFLGMDTNFPSQSSVDLQSDNFLFASFGSNKTLLTNQKEFANDRLERLNEIIILIDQEINTLTQ